MTTPSTAHAHAEHTTSEGSAGINSMAASATLHCLTGCSIGEIVGLVIGSAAGLSNLPTIAVSVGLAFVFGYSLSSLPLLKAGLAAGAVASVVLASDTVSILVMEVVDNLTELLIPGAMNAGLTNPTFWWSMAVSLTLAFAAAYPVNRMLLQRGKGHAVTHQAYDQAPEHVPVWRRHLPAPPPTALAGGIAAFILGALLVAVAGTVA